MHDLRKQAILESGKTTSRKKQRNLQTGSGTATPVLSRAASAVTSRNASDDEDDGSLVSSLDDVGSLVASLPADVWTADLDARIAALTDRKGSSTDGREAALNAFCNLICFHYAREELAPHVGALLPALLKSVRAGESAREAELALRAVSLVMVTDPTAETFAAAEAVVKTAAEDAAHASAKTAALRALAVLQFFSESHLDSTEELMDFYLDVISSDGMSIGEEDSAGAVLAALEEWGFLASLWDSLPPSASTAVDVFIDQLESSEPDVICAAAENLALLIELSYSEADSDSDDDDASATDSPPHTHALDHEARRVVALLTDLTKQSLKSVSKSDRRSLKSTIADVIQTAEDPRRGPGYSTALDGDGAEYGARLRVAVDNRGRRITVQDWATLLRLAALKRLLHAGFMPQYQFNRAVSGVLPAATYGGDGGGAGRRPYANDRQLRHIEDILEHHS